MICAIAVHTCHKYGWLPHNANHITINERHPMSSDNVLIKPIIPRQTNASKQRTLGHRFLIFCFTEFFRNKLRSEDEIKIKIKFLWTIFQFN